MLIKSTYSMYSIVSNALCILNSFNPQDSPMKGGNINPILQLKK